MNHFVRNGRPRPRGVFCCERPIRQNPHDAGQNSFESTIFSPKQTRQATESKQISVINA